LAYKNSNAAEGFLKYFKDPVNGFKGGF
jgi:hypothetical protein